MACPLMTIRDVITFKSTEKQFHLAGRHESRFWEGGIAQTDRTVDRLRQNKIARASSNSDSLCPEKKTKGIFPAVVEIVKPSTKVDKTDRPTWF